MVRRMLLMIVLTIATLACALNSRPTLPPTKMAELWRAPTDLERRDLLYGPGGPARAPDSRGRYQFLAVKGGTQPGYDVRDERGRQWSVKQGIEARTEVVVSRIVWALGYRQPYVYYLPEWILTRDGQDRVEPGGRFRIEPGAHTKIGEWSWRDNPFLGTRQMGGLLALMVMVNNWDLKAEQNAIYQIADPNQETARWYVIRDLGASFGKTGWPSRGTKDDLPAFEREPFIRRIEGNRVRFHFQGAWREPQVHSSVTPDDVRWICRQLTRLSEKQWMDAFRAGGYDEAEATPYIRRLQQKIAEGLNVG